jgi:hypothetical protein
MKATWDNGLHGGIQLRRLAEFSTLQVPILISKGTAGRESYRTLYGILETPFPTNGDAGAFCVVLGILDPNNKQLREEKIQGRNFTLGDNAFKNFRDGLEYSLNKLYPQKCDSEESFRNWFNIQLVDDGYDIITSSKYDVLCDILINALDV